MFAGNTGDLAHAQTEITQRLEQVAKLLNEINDLAGGSHLVVAVGDRIMAADVTLVRAVGSGAWSVRA